jgi:hypothetical protein
MDTDDQHTTAAAHTAKAAARTAAATTDPHYLELLRAARHHTRTTLMQPDMARVSCHLASWVSKYHTAHGHGPIRSHFATHAGLAELLQLPAPPDHLSPIQQRDWQRTLRNESLLILRAQGWLRWTDQPGSLHPGPRYLAYRTRKAARQAQTATDQPPPDATATPQHAASPAPAKAVLLQPA